MKSLIKKLLIRRNCIISRPPGQFNIDAWKYGQLKKRGITIRSAVDGGAATGTWAQMLKSIYPEARILCVEPRRAAFAQLTQWCESQAGVVPTCHLLGEQTAVVEFNEMSDQSSVLNMADGKSFGVRTESTMATLDQLIQSENFPDPDLIKLDLQGYELKALGGASNALKKCELVELEVSLFPFQEGQPMVFDVMSFMDKAGFRLYDILGLLNRPLDGALGQGNFLFVSKSSKAIDSVAW